jgi:lysophospholipase L1-like esterase
MTGAAAPGRLVVFRGDSITAGLHAPRGLDYVSLVERRLTPCGARCVRLGVPGETASEMAERAAAEIDPLYDPRLGRNVIVLLAGTNDLDAGTPGEAIAGRVAAFCRFRRARGFAVVAATVPPHGATDALERLERERQALNAALRADWREFADALADLGGDPALGDPRRADDSDLFVDRVHPAAGGHAIIARYVAEAVEALL